MAKQLRITGTVQGVGYRAFLVTQARALQLSGWVRNRADGSVEAMVRGNAAALTLLIEQAKRGPALAKVDAVSVADVDDQLVPELGFEQRATQ